VSAQVDHQARADLMFKELGRVRKESEALARRCLTLETLGNRMARALEETVAGANHPAVAEWREKVPAVETARATNMERVA
jgi:hypothetical protein